MFNGKEAAPMMFMLRQLLKSSPIKETPIPDEHLPAELSSLAKRLANTNCELRRIEEPKSGFIAYYVIAKGSPNLSGI